MIAALVQVSWRRLARDPAALALTFLLPVVLFSVFAAVFGQMDSGRPTPVRTAIVMEDDHALSERLAEALRAAPELDAWVAPAGGDDVARRLASGEVTARVVVPRGFGRGAGEPGTPAIELSVDRANPVAWAFLPGLVEGAAARAVAEEQLGAGAAAPPPGLRVVASDANAAEGRQVSVAFHAAGIGVMFLLLSMCMRAGDAIEDRERGITARLVAAGVGAGQRVLGRWLFLAAVGMVQLTVMFAWAALAFGLDLSAPATLAATAAMSVVTAAAGAAFGLLVASLCRSRGQLQAVAVIAVLAMSALGGSMVPRFLMPPELVEAGRLTFNAWALDGFQKALWYGQPVTALATEVAVLAAACVVCLLVAAAAEARAPVA